MSNQNRKQLDLLGNETLPEEAMEKKTHRSKADKQVLQIPEKLGKAIRLQVPDFSDPNRKMTCLEADFPIAQINELSTLEGNAGKPIYQVSKWWARRRSSVFRSMLIAAAAESPDDPNEAAKRIWNHYYCNHQKAGSFKKLRVLDCFMGGGTTLVEGSRLGMQMTGVDLNPVAWFVVKNELACSDPEQVKAFFDYIEQQVKPQIQPFYTTTCPRGHQGRWVDVQSREPVSINPIELPPEQRSNYQWEGPEVIYTFWAKHGHCQARGCEHRTPIFSTPIVAEKKLSTSYTELICPSCGTKFHAELGETYIAPGAERVVLEKMPFTELTQDFARILNDYDKGKASDTLERALELRSRIQNEPGVNCPHCGTFAGKRLVNILEQHTQPNIRASQRKKNDFGLKNKSVQMYLLIHPEWLKGISGFKGDQELGGWSGAPAGATAAWFDQRLMNLSIVEVRGESLPDNLILSDGTVIKTDKGTVPQKANFTCGRCGRQSKTLGAVKAIGHTAPLAPYVLQCYCPECKAEGYNYGGRYFKIPDTEDIARLKASDTEWEQRRDDDLKKSWPREKMQYSHMTHERNPLPDHGYTHWWMLYNNRQLLVHSLLLNAITLSPEEMWPLDVREQGLGVFQQYLRNQNMFSIWNIQRDTPEPFFSEGNYNPKNLVIENCVFPELGRGNWQSSSSKCIDALEWVKTPWERVKSNGSGPTKSITVNTEDPIIPGSEVYCGSSTNLSFLGQKSFDLVITDPPFGNNYYYADLSDFFYVWLRIPLRKWYADMPEQQYFVSERTPHSMEAIDNPAEHPDYREDYEKSPFIKAKYLNRIQEITDDISLGEKDPNPLYQPEPSSDFYCQTLSACWTEASNCLKDGGIMVFTFHHNDDYAWIDVLKALFNAGYVLLQTFPVIGDESKGENASFGSKKIEYDVIHVCRKRLEDPEPVSWARMRRWVKDEALHLKELLEHAHGKELPESDLRVILRGKSLEFYSRHYGKVFTGTGQLLDVRDALLGINQLLDDLLDSTQTEDLRPPESVEPASHLYMRLFRNRTEMDRDELHKMLRGTGFSQDDLEAKGWVRVVSRTVYVVSIQDRFSFFTGPGRNRKVIKTDLDQAHFLIGAALPKSGLKIDVELNNRNFQIKKSVDDILKWYSVVEFEPQIKRASMTAAQLVEHWRANRDKPQSQQLTLSDILEE